MYNMINIINTAVCYIWKILREQNPKNSHHKKKKYFSFFSFVFIWDDGCSLNLLWSSFHDVCESNHYVHLKLTQCCILCHNWTGRKNKLKHLVNID